MMEEQNRDEAAPVQRFVIWSSDVSDVYKVTIEIINDDGSTAKCEVAGNRNELDGTFVLGSLVGQAVNGVWNQVEFCEGENFAEGLNDFLPEEFKVVVPSR
jgi:hypothetical protein